MSGLLTSLHLPLDSAYPVTLGVQVFSIQILPQRAYITSAFIGYYNIVASIFFSIPHYTFQDLRLEPLGLLVVS